MTGTPSTPARLFAWLALRSTANAVRVRLKRLKEPRYLVGLAFGIVYVLSVIGSRTRGPRAGRAAAGALPPEVAGMLLLLGASLLAALVAVLWVFRRGNPSLALSEGEATFLFTAPLSRRAVVSYALLRPQLGVLFGALVASLAFGPRSASSFRTFLGGWLGLAALQLHLQAMAFWKARLEERPPAVRRAVKAGVALLAVALVAAVAHWLWKLPTAFPAAPSWKLLRSAPAIWEGLLPWRSGFVPAVLLLPFKAALAPALAPDAATFLRALPAALGLLVLNYVWLVSTEASFEEATLAAAQERDRRRAARAGGRAERLPSARRRGVVPFRLAGPGRPEVAILWKGLLATGRRSLAAVGGLVAALLLLAAAAPAAVLRFVPEAFPAFAVVAVVVPVVTAVVCVLVPIGLRNDLRSDLSRAGILKTWPLRPERLVAAELLAPLVQVVTGLSVGVGIGVALSVGIALAPVPPGTEVWLRPGLAVAAGLAGLLILPAVAAVVLVVQNAAVLAFPAWFPPGDARPTGLEATGSRLLGFLGTTLVLAVAAIPAALLALPLVLVMEPLGLLFWPLAALAASLPLWGEAALGVAVLARLWERFDPSVDLPS